MHADIHGWHISFQYSSHAALLRRLLADLAQKFFWFRSPMCGGVLQCPKKLQPSLRRQGLCMWRAPSRDHEGMQYCHEPWSWSGSWTILIHAGSLLRERGSFIRVYLSNWVDYIVSACHVFGCRKPWIPKNTLNLSLNPKPLNHPQATGAPKQKTSAGFGPLSGKPYNMPPYLRDRPEFMKRSPLEFEAEVLIYGYCWGLLALINFSTSSAGGSRSYFCSWGDIETGSHTSEARK